MININNYFRETESLNFKAMPEAIQKGHDYVVKATNNGENWNAYRSSEGIKKVIDLYLVELNKKAGIHKETKAAPAKAENPPRALKQRPAKTTLPKKAGKKSKKDKPQKPHAKGVEHLGEDVKFIKRFLGFHLKEKSHKQVLAYIKSLQRAIVQKLISKTSRFATEVREIQESVVGIYNKMGETAKVQINATDLARYVSIAGGEEVFLSVRLIKRFIGMTGKPLEHKPALSLLEAIDRAEKSGRLKGDPYEGNVKSIKNLLKKYQNGQKVVVSNAELNGLEGILKGCGCHKNSVRKTLVPLKKTKKHRGLSGIMTAEEIANQEFDLLPFTGKWERLIGRPEKNFTMMIHGEPSSGKTTLMMQFIKYLSSFAPVLYVSSEEYGSVTLTDKVNRYLQPIPSNISFASAVVNEDLSGFGFVVLDSINDLGLDLEGFKQLRADYPDTAFIFILQHTKDGNFRGGKEWEHEAQVVGKVSNGVISIYKNRYGVKGEMDFFN